MGLRLVGVLPCAVFAPKAPKSSSLAAQRQSTAPYSITKSQANTQSPTSSSTVTTNTSSESVTGATGNNNTTSTTATCHCSSSNIAAAVASAVNNSQSKAGTLNLPPPLPPVPPRPPRVPLPIFAAANLASIRPLPVQSSSSCSSSSVTPVGAATTVHHHHYNTAPPPPPVPPTAALNPMLLVPFSVPAGLGTTTIPTNHPGSGYTGNLGKVSGDLIVLHAHDLNSRR